MEKVILITVLIGLIVNFYVKLIDQGRDGLLGRVDLFSIKNERHLV